MNYDYLDRIRSAISLYTRRRTSNILEGSFRSVYRGRSMEFDDLKEYVPGDDVHDIDWKSSSRTGKVLIRRYMAERRHNVLFLPDSSRGMLAHMPSGEVKWEVALMAAGVIAYLMDGQGADYAFLFGGARGMQFSGFRTGNIHLETLLHTYRNVMQDGQEHTPFAEVLDRAAEIDLRKKIIVVLTDRKGLTCLDDRRLKKLSVNNDLLVLCMEDVMLTGTAQTARRVKARQAEKEKKERKLPAGRLTAAGAGNRIRAIFRRYLTPDRTYDLEAGHYEDLFVISGRALQEAERREREEGLAAARARLRRSRGGLAVIESEADILDRTLELFERYRHEYYG